MQVVVIGMITVMAGIVRHQSPLKFVAYTVKWILAVANCSYVPIMVTVIWVMA